MKNEYVIISLCFGLIVSQTFEKGYLIGLSVLIILLLSNLVISLLKKKSNVTINLIITGLFTSLMSFLLYYFMPTVFDNFKLILPITVVSLSSYQTFNSKQTLGKDMLVTLKNGLLMTLIFIFVGTITELFNNNTITLMNDISSLTGYRLIFKNILPFTINMPIGLIYIIIGLLLGIGNIRRIKNESN